MRMSRQMDCPDSMTFIADRNEKLPLSRFASTNHNFASVNYQAKKALICLAMSSLQAHKGSWSLLRRVCLALFSLGLLRVILKLMRILRNTILARLA